ncbi:MlaA family lipoprotein [Pseudoduganella namucuonensis]|uniref:Phospholipid-binding lipoprotein MlaA n=1 Tax=Pseudoduganella namucuonensis TaxID=1035707 RepID=A0A1I7JDE3_9BURK|nr:VacJ family lipoprotein [Pseudoduganella namucuonensis]SFU83164.1 phospholipid-binding lipoprotein MlaA [Pseudoduganella namucuonensis]
MFTMVLLVSGCASLAEKDPYGKLNRQIFSFNDAVDRNALRPAATAYQSILPDTVRTGVTNFFANLSDACTGTNNLLQGKAKAGLSDFGRVLINSTVGIAGVLDVATWAGLAQHDGDFGQTLGFWGVPSGPYLMLPLLGPSTVRDASALPVDMAADPWSLSTSGGVKMAGTLVRLVDDRAGLLEATDLMDAAALDRYAFLRDGHLQRRKGKVRNGEPAAPAPPEGLR